MKLKHQATMTEESGKRKKKELDRKEMKENEKE